MQEILPFLSSKIEASEEVMKNFFAENFKKSPPLFYNSVDLRHSGFKIAPVDTNCFPAGFNNMSSVSRQKAQQLFANYFSESEKKFGAISKVLILPEAHTRNLRYIENVLAIKEIIAATGREVLVGTINPDITTKIVIELENVGNLELHPIQNKNGKIIADNGFEPDFIVLNNDFTDQIPEILKNCEVPIAPSPKLGWFQRTKSQHFSIYNELATELAKLLKIDPWLISTMHNSCGNVDFKNPDREVGGVKCVAKSVDKLIAELKQKYTEYGINEDPYCFVKSDNGTYGMAVWAVKSGAEVLEMNKKDRNKMNTIKGSLQNTKIIVQEGVKTMDTIDGKTCEPMIYLANGGVAANLFRINQQRDAKVSLNAGGVEFCDLVNLTANRFNTKLPFEKLVKIYEMVSRLAALAAAKEMSMLSGT